MLDDRFCHGAGECTEHLMLVVNRGSAIPKMPGKGHIMYASEDQIWARIRICSDVSVPEINLGYYVIGQSPHQTSAIHRNHGRYSAVSTISNLELTSVT